MISEHKFRKNTKLVETFYRCGKVFYEGVEIGEVTHCYHGYKAFNKEGKQIGLANSKYEAKWMIAESFVGTENIKWKGEAQ